MTPLAIACGYAQWCADCRDSKTFRADFLEQKFGGHVAVPRPHQGLGLLVSCCSATLSTELPCSRPPRGQNSWGSVLYICIPGRRKRTGPGQRDSRSRVPGALLEACGRPSPFLLLGLSSCREAGKCLALLPHKIRVPCSGGGTQYVRGWRAVSAPAAVITWEAPCTALSAPYTVRSEVPQGQWVQPAWEDGPLCQASGAVGAEEALVVAGKQVSVHRDFKKIFLIKV